MAQHQVGRVDAAQTNIVSRPETLRRSLSLPLVVLYGMGTTVGAGIYALIGEISGTAGIHAPLSFLLAGGAAGLTALTFAELSARFPKSAGEAVYVREGLGIPGAPLVVGLLVVLAGSVSAAAIANAFVGYLTEVVVVGRLWVLVGLVGLLVAIAIWGIGESVRVAGLITVIEIAGLLLIAWVARDVILPTAATILNTPPIWGNVMGGSVLAFYAFLGFEDMVNVAEEVNDASRTLPRAILWTLGLTSLLYVLLATAAVGVVPPEVLARSEAPLVRVWEDSTGGDGALITWISLAAVLNGALIQVIMASRVLYGLSAQGWLPSVVSRIYSPTQTPVLATALVGVVVVVLAIGFPLGPLARATSIITLLIFALVNAALLNLKRAPAPEGIFQVPRVVPWLGMSAALGLLAFGLWQQFS